MSKKSFSALLLCAVLLLAAGCTQAETAGGLGNGWEPEYSMELQYATQFAVDYYAGGYKLLSLADGSRFLLIPEQAELPEGLAEDIVPLYQPVQNIYLVATSAMCLFDALDQLDAISLSGTRENGWYNENAQAAMREGRILYAGKYSEPDYELILASNCGLAVESTMIGHMPEVKEKLEDLGIAVLIDQSSLEPHPLGRTEWMKLYGALLNQEERADALFAQQVEYLQQLADVENTGKTVAFFYISSSGNAVVRRPGDYVSKMIELAGGNYVFSRAGAEQSATSTMIMEMESFYAAASEADYIIYNSAVAGELNSLDELLALNDVLKNFKAVREGNVWCTSENLFQETTQLGRMINDFHLMLTSADPDSAGLTYLYRLQ